MSMYATVRARVFWVLHLKSSDSVGSNGGKTAGFRRAAERGPDSGTGVCTLRRGAVCVRAVGKGAAFEWLPSTLAN